MKIKIPKFSLVVMIGVSSAGKSSFAKKHFKKTEIVSSDECRAIISDDENDQTVTKDAFALLHYIIAKRLKNQRLTIVDATSVQTESRKSLINLARKYNYVAIAIVLDIPEQMCQDRHKVRQDRNFEDYVISKQYQDLKRSIKYLKSEGFRKVHILRSAETVDAITGIVRV
ncbi:AAA family ATPase [Candidatus Marithrix sp. Canyon 246]|nr:AAA family ATPase [Candidatus Marithrix sp. Canyon 246]